MRNRLLAARGRPNLVEAQYMKVQVDFGLTSGSEKKVHFRSLSKRTRDRIMLSSDDHNNWQAKDAQKQLVKAKKQKTAEKEAYLVRRQQILTQGISVKDQYTNDFEIRLKYWQEKCDSLQQKMRTNQDNQKRTMQKLQVLSSVCVRPLSLHALVISRLFTPFVRKQHVPCTKKGNTNGRRHATRRRSNFALCCRAGSCLGLSCLRLSRLSCFVFLILS